jgi:hypothetical protein
MKWFTHFGANFCRCNLGIGFTFGSYGEWLRSQGNGIQDSILGATRADLWRRGRMTLADAVDADGRTLSLEELAKRLGLSSTSARDRILI